MRTAVSELLVLLALSRRLSTFDATAASVIFQAGITRVIDCVTSVTLLMYVFALLSLVRSDCSFWPFALYVWAAMLRASPKASGFSFQSIFHSPTTSSPTLCAALSVSALRVLIRVFAVSILALQSLTAFSAFFMSSVNDCKLLRFASKSLRSFFKEFSFCSPSFILPSRLSLRMVVEASNASRLDRAASSSFSKPQDLQASAAFASALATVWSLSNAFTPRS